MKSHDDKTLREQLIHALHGDQSHITFAEAIKDFPAARAGDKPAGAPHSAWELLEHLRIAQSDILEFSRDPHHKSPQWPEGYWPQHEAPLNADAWHDSVKAFQKDHKAFEQLILEPHEDLEAKIPGGEGQTLLREALVLAAHNSYHLGQLMFLKKMLQA